MTRTSLTIALALTAAACASAPPAPPAPPGPTFEQKHSWILRLEDQRMLRDPVKVLPPPPPPVRGQKPVIIPPPPPPPDLVRLLGDDEARVRRRAALAIGRVGLRDGAPPLRTLLTADAEPEVRQMAAFGLGLLRDADSREMLERALQDPSPLVQGSAAEALGLIGASGAADAIARMASAILQSGALATPPPDEESDVRDSPPAAFRLALYALVRLNAYDALASVVLDGAQPRVRWWPVAYALQRLEDRRAVPALAALAGDAHAFTRAFAAKGLGALGDRSVVPVLVQLVADAEPMVSVEAIRALGRLGDPASSAPLMKVVHGAKPHPTLRLEAVSALGGIAGEGVFDTLLDVLADPAPPVRAAALRGLVQLNPEGFVTVLSGLDPDPHWSVRSALATALGSLPPDVAVPRLRAMLTDADERVRPAVIAALTKLRPPDLTTILLEQLKHNDPVVRGAAAAAIGELRPPNAESALAEAYRAGAGDVAYTGRAAALTALAAYGPAAATSLLTEALTDKDWAVRARAATLLTGLDAGRDAATEIRPAPTAHPPEFYATTRLVNPPVSTQLYIETDRGLIQIELAVIDAPLAVENIVALARNKFYDGLAFHRVVPNFVIQGGDPRGDGEGGPGHTVRDELSQRPFVRGTVGLALDWADTAGSQFFITHSPQPHLDGRYTVIGRVTRGIEVVDQIQPWDVMRRVLVWDGQELR